MSTRNTGDVLEVRLYAPSDEGRILLHESDQRRPSRMLPRKPYQEQAGSIRDPTAMHNATIGSLDPRSVLSTPGQIDLRRPDDRVPLGLASVLEDRSTAWSLDSRVRSVTPDGLRRRALDPISTSHVASFRPRRESVLTFMNPTIESHQNRSLPSKRCGNDGMRCPIARLTFLVAASSSAIW
jgi:hypothetical protein